MDKREMNLHKGLMKLLNDGTFELKAREVPAFMEVYRWAQTLMDPEPEPIKLKKKAKK